MIHRDDVVLMISNSGETEEILRILPFLQHQKNKTIAMTGNISSTLAKNSGVALDVSVEEEACTINLAPSSSTTNTLAMGDALAITLSTLKNFQPEDFARFHPGGSLGRKLLTKVKDVMHEKDLPISNKDTSFKSLISIINQGRLGLSLVYDQEELVGIITDGDIRRAFDTHHEISPLQAKDIMSQKPHVINQNQLLSSAEDKMKRHKINTLIVTNESQKVVGLLQIYD